MKRPAAKGDVIAPKAEGEEGADDEESGDDEESADDD